MSLIANTPPAEARDEVAGLYQRLQGRKDYLPNYALVFGHRPALMAPLATLQEALKEHMEPRLWALVSLAAAREIKASYCALAFSKRLILREFTEDELIEILRDETSQLLSARERAAVRLATRVARDSSRVGREEIDAARNAGFSDMEIFDLVAAGAWRCFFAKIPDALGSTPDRDLGQLKQELLDLVVLGRELEPDPNIQESHADASRAPSACDDQAG